jgi:CRISPR-associated endonuclease/helicase Cas3
MKFSRLLAKSLDKDLLEKDCPTESPLTLIGHTTSVVDSGNTLLENILNYSLMTFLQTQDEDVYKRVKSIVKLANFIHDLGKCGSHFQEMIRGERSLQGMRHEALSFLLTYKGVLSKWLRVAVKSDLDYLFAVLSAAGHHRKFPRSPEEDTGKEIVLFLSHPDFIELLNKGSEWLGLEKPETYEDVFVPLVGKNNIGIQIDNYRDEIDYYLENISYFDRKVLALCKILVINSDVCGSAYIPSVLGNDWIKKQLTTRATKEEIMGIINARLKGNSLREFQNIVSESTAPITLVKAGCGSGKTVANYAWWAKQYANKQLYVAYPTTGTSTEGYRDYLNGKNIAGVLEHSRANIDIKIFDLDENKKDKTSEERIQSLKTWGAKAVVCTVDMVLGLLQNQRKGIYSWPGLCNSAIVFDEIHSYDDHLFSNLLCFLETFPSIPVLLMTASLPQNKLEILRSVVKKIHKTHLVEIDGPKELEALPRYYQLKTEDKKSFIEKAKKSGEKVLWICNTVGSVFEVESIYKEFNPIIYHSRFKYCDRIQRHRDIIDAFDEDRPGFVFAITTQVAESSLDISAYNLIMDECPIPSGIQRLGRLNRRTTPEKPIPPRPFIVNRVKNYLPYTEEAIVEMREWLKLLPKNISQKDLVDNWNSDSKEKRLSISIPLIDSAFETKKESGQVRDDLSGVTVILPQDKQAVIEGRVKASEVALPMSPNKKYDYKLWECVGFYPVPPVGVIEYDSMRGGKWK